VAPVRFCLEPSAPIGQQSGVERDRSDAAVIASSLSDPSRFGEIFDRHFREINRYLARRIGGALADELAAETFVVAFGSRDRYDRQAPDARPWLFGIAANLIRRHWRTERRRLRAYARTGVDPVGDECSEVERRVDADAAVPALAAALAALSGTEREVLLLFAWADLSYDEISTALRIPAGTVRSRLSRARAHVRELLEPSGQVTVDSATEGGTHE
jgi:RNA polymerase sigma factor (sigma-70 family)